MKLYSDCMVFIRSSRHPPPTHRRGAIEAAGRGCGRNGPTKKNSAWVLPSLAMRV